MENKSNSGVVYQGKIPGRVKYCFAFGALGKDLIYGMIATFSMIYFTDIIKVAPAFIGTMFFVAKLWDAFNDLFMGMIVDNTRSRWGKFVPWLVIGTLINSFVFVTVFTDFHLSGVSLCVFASVVYVLWGMTYTIMDIPYWSIIPNLTSDPEEREKVSVLPRIFASIGQSLIIAGFGVQIIKELGGNYIGYHRFALIIAATFIFTMAIYDMDDTFMSDYIDKLQNELETCTFNGKKILYEIFDAEGNANRQEHQLQYMYEQNFDALLINLVTPSSAASVLNETANHKLPVILFNRETDKKDLSISKQTWYVGTQAKKAGAIQADMLQNAWKENQKKLDHNKNNTLDYILIEGEQTHFDSIRRTNGFLENSQNLPLNQLANLSADWQRQLATEKFANLDKTLIHSAEAVICNNDDMALGVYDYYKQHNMSLPLIIGINNNPEMHQKIKSGEIYGTVDNDINSQITHICKLLKDILNHNTSDYANIWYSTPFAIQR